MKYHLRCRHCGCEIADFGAWLAQGQQCRCGKNYAEVEYDEPLRLPSAPPATPSYQDYYFGLLPLQSRDNIVSCGEGLIPIERWSNLEAYAASKGVECEVYVYRNDLNAGSGSFKDISAALAASVLKEHGVKEYCLASTGNAGVAFATYTAKAGIAYTAFAPNCIDPDTVAAIRRTGQRIVISQGGYGAAKEEAANYHKDNKVLISIGNTDPLRIESKRLAAMECLRQMGKLPTVYMQAVAGGTSPLAFEKGFRDLQQMASRGDSGMDPAALRLPRMILVQQDECDPMVRAWEKATAAGFPEGWERQYEALHDIKTRIGILTAANPGNYPLVAPLVRRSGGTFVRVAEAALPRYGKEMLRSRGLLLGPASMVCYAGFFEAVDNGLIHNGDSVLLNTGEGCDRAAWFKALVDEEK
ncbi:MAG: pyridoxal-phosphate dependent enzyme [Bacteroidales bacterium]|nr:pyridoxal-phosphate dependent enzyme [Bacteroidales bacterium]